METAGFQEPGLTDPLSSHSIYSYHGRVRSPLGEDVSAGGSSGGSAVAVATDQCWA